MPENDARWYRLELHHDTIVVMEFYVVKTTPKGVWLAHIFGSAPRFVLRDARKRYACSSLSDGARAGIRTARACADTY
jgi:hypothetical protein